MSESSETTEPFAHFLSTVNKALSALAFKVREALVDGSSVGGVTKDILVIGVEPQQLTDKDFAVSLDDVRESLDKVTSVPHVARQATGQILAAESLYCATCLEELIGAGDEAVTDICRMRAAGDALLRFAASTLYGLGFSDDSRLVLARLAYQTSLEKL